MHLFKERRISLIITALAGLGAVLFFLFRQQPPPLEVKLPDGSVLRFEKIEYGIWHPLKLDGPFEGVKESIRTIWLRWKYPQISQLAKGSSTWGWGNELYSRTNQADLQIWVTRTYPGVTNGANSVARVNLETIQIADEDGCVFPASRQGGGMISHVANNIRDMTSVEAGWFSYTAFPRNEKELKLRIFEYTPSRRLTEVAVPNPAPHHGKSPEWVAAPLPATNSSGDLTFILKGLDIKTQYSRSFPGQLVFGHPAELIPLLDVVQKGELISEPDAFDFELYDSAGNFASKMYDNSLMLCPLEPVWKLRVRFFGGESSTTSNQAWNLPVIKVPAAGQASLLNLTNQMLGVRVKVRAIAGPGNIDYAVNGSISASISNGLPLANSRGMTFYTGWGSPNTSYQLQTTNVHLTMMIGGMTHDQRLTLEAKDDQGRKFPAYPWDWDWGRPEGTHYIYRPDGEEPLFLFLDLPSDSKTLALTVCIHTPCVADFIVRPPRR